MTKHFILFIMLLNMLYIGISANNSVLETKRHMSTTPTDIQMELSVSRVNHIRSLDY